MSRRALLALALLGAWHLALRANGARLPLITDEGEYAVAARAWNAGGLPYRDAFSQKPPMTLLLYRVPAPPRALAAAASLATMAALFAAAPAALPLAARLCAPAAYASLSTLPLGAYGFAANTEVFLNLFAAAAALALLRGRAGLAGLLLGGALMCKQTAAPTAAAFLAAAAMLGGRGYALRLLGGLLVLPAAFWGYFAARGAGDAYLDAAWRGNLRYAAVLAMTGSLGEQAGWFARALLPWLLLYFAPALALLAWGLRGLRAGRARPAETLGVLWLGGAAAGALTGLFLFPHYFLQLAAPLAFCAALGAARLPAGRMAPAAALLALWPALLAPRLYFLDGPRELGARLLHPNPLFETKALGETLAARARPGDRLHVFGSEAALHVYSGLPPATRHTLSYALTLFPRSPEAVAEELAAFDRARPRFVVWSAQPLSTMISSRLGLAYRDALRARLESSYRYAGSMPVGGPAPVLLSPAPGEKPDFTPGDRFLLFERL